jgi:hypothetical protein
MICSFMNARPATDSSIDHTAWAQGVLRRQVDRLEQLAEARLRMALAIEADVSAQTSEGKAVDAGAKAFSRIARAVRMTGLLQARLIEDMDRAERRAACDRQSEARRAQDEAEEQAESHKGRVEAIVARMARGQGHDEDQIERLIGEAAERLDDEDLYGEVLARPVGELVALICRDLGLEPDWDQLGQEAWAVEEIAGGDPGSPFLARAAGKADPNHQGHQVHQDGGGANPGRTVPFHARL